MVKDDIIDLGNGTWFSKAESDQRKRWEAEMENRTIEMFMLGRIDTSPIQSKKWAWIEVDGNRIMAWVDNITMVAYEADGYDETDIEIKEYKFIRWCTPHDL